MRRRRSERPAPRGARDGGAGGGVGDGRSCRRDAGGSPRPRAGAVGLALVLLLAGCAASGPPPSATPPGAGALVPGPSGLLVAGTGLEIGFGRAQAGAVAATSRLVGPPSGREPCGGSGEVVRWSSGLALHFPGGALAGWERGGRSAGRLCGAPS